MQKMETAVKKLQISNRAVTYYLRDMDASLVAAWQEEFKQHQDHVKISRGDIFSGAPPVDAIVTPSNSFGFISGAIGDVCRKHFGHQLQTRLRNIIVDSYNGEVLVGQAVIIRAYDPKSKQAIPDKAIKYFISAPTMRVSLDVSDTPNVYLSFRAILLAVHKHNRKEGNDPIRSVLIPGLGTGGGKMPKARSAHQMLQAYETFVVESQPQRIAPTSLQNSSKDHAGMCQYGRGQSS